MIAVRTAVVQFRTWAAGALDAVGVVLLAWLWWRVMFLSGESFQGAALLVGAVGVAASCAAGRSTIPRVPVALAAYTAVALVSAVWHRPGEVSAEDWWQPFDPVSHLGVMLVFVVGAAFLLRTAGRLAVMSVAVTAAACVLAGQALFDQSINRFVIRPVLQTMVPSASQWKGVHDLTFAIGVGVPLALAPGFVFRKGRLIGAGLLLASLPVLASYAMSSRGGTASMIAVAGTMVVLAVGGSRFHRTLPVLAAIAASLVTGVAVALFGFGALQELGSLSGRPGIWVGTLSLIREHPWLGVGPGNYVTAMMAAGLDDVGYFNAHNLLLHVAAEVGVAGGLLLLIYVGTSLRNCRQAWLAGSDAVAAAGLFFMLILLAIRWSADTFIEGSHLAERHRVIVWTMFAAVLSVEQRFRNRLAAPEPRRNAG